MNYEKFRNIIYVEMYNFGYNQKKIKYILISSNVFWMLMAVDDSVLKRTRNALFYLGIEVLEVCGKEKDFVEVI